MLNNNTVACKEIALTLFYRLRSRGLELKCRVDDKSYLHLAVEKKNLNLIEALSEVGTFGSNFII